MSVLSTIISKGYHSVVHFFAHHKTYTAFLFIIASGIVFFALFSSPQVTKETYTVALAPVKQYVKVSGQVTASRDANLSFQTTGSVAFVGIKTGDVVQQGKVLATLSAGDAQASLLQAEASLANAQALLGQLQQGARKEEVAVKEQALENAKSSLDQAYGALPDAIQNVDAVTADVIKNKFANFFTRTNGRYQLSFSSCDQRLQGDVEQKRNALEESLATFQTKSSVITTISSSESVDGTFELAYRSALATNDLVNAISNLLLLSCSTGNSSLDTFRVSLSVVKASMTSLFSDISVKRSALIVAKNTFNQSRADLDLTKAGSDPYKIKAQSALVSQAEAQVASARSGLSKTMIVAPFSGVISNVDLSLGETISLGKTVVSMLAQDGYEIEAKVPEVDIIKIKVGADVDVTLDAYGKDIIFPAKVTRINPTATTEGTVPVYKVIVTFSGKDERIRQGMTANVQIISESKSSVTTVPARFVNVLTSDSGSVTVLKNNKEEVRTIRLGIRDTRGLFEVIDGVIVGDVILSPLTTDRQAQKQTN